MQDQKRREWTELIISDPLICHGTPSFKGTRIPVHVVLDNLAEGASADEIHLSYPTLPAGAIRAALAYAATLARGRVAG